MFFKRDWKDVTLDEFINIVNNYIKWYNETRIKQTLGYKSPIENIRQNIEFIENKQSYELFIDQNALFF